MLMASPTKGPDPNPEDADTPELSAPGSPSPSEASSSSAISSPSRCSSAFGSPPPPAAAVGQETEHPLPIPSKKSKSRALHPMTTMKNGGYERPLTRRQRKALGLPKLRAGLGVPGAIERAGSAGTIVIPGGKFRRGGEGDGQVKVKVEEDVDAEWRKNGTGRVDVRGFRELKI